MTSSKSKRLLNFIIDYLFIGVVLNTIVVIIFYDFDSKRFIISTIEKRIIIGVGTVIYYFFCELIWSQTLGKRITKTIVVNLNGSKPNAINLFIRSLTRLIPIYPISFLGCNAPKL